MNTVRLKMVITFLMVTVFNVIVFSQNNDKIILNLTKTKLDGVFIYENNKEISLNKIKKTEFNKCDSILVKKHNKVFFTYGKQKPKQYSFALNEEFLGDFGTLMYKIDNMEIYENNPQGTSHMGVSNYFELFHDGLFEDTLSLIEYNNGYVIINNSTDEKSYYYLVYQQDDQLFYNIEPYAVDAQKTRKIKKNSKIEGSFIVWILGSDNAFGGIKSSNRISSIYYE